MFPVRLRYAKFGILTLLLVLTAELTATVASALSGPLPTYWANSSINGSHIDFTQMMYAQDGYCWLTTISGAIRDNANDDAVWIDIDDFGYWRLTAQDNGTSTTVAAAACISWSDFNGGELGMSVDNNWANTRQTFPAPQPNPVCSISGITGDWSTDSSSAWAFGGGTGGTPGFENTSNTNIFVDVNCTSRTAPSTATYGSCFRNTCGQISDNNHICMIRYIAQYNSPNSVYATLFQGSDGSWGAVTGPNTGFLYFCVQL